MLVKDYVLGYIKEQMENGVSVDELKSAMGIHSEFLGYVEQVVKTGVKLEDDLRGVDVVRMYEEGFTFSEIAWVRGVTKEAVRLIIDRIIGEKKAKAKVVSKTNRNRLRSIILYNELVVGIEKEGIEETLKRSGYTKAVFNRLVRDSRKWKEELENPSAVSGDE